MLVAHFAFLQSGVSVAEPPYFPLGRCKLRSNKELWLACIWDVPGNRQLDSDTAFFLLSETGQNHLPELWAKGKVPMMEGKSLPCSVPSRGDCPISIDGGWGDPVPLLVGIWVVHNHPCLSVCPFRHPLPSHPPSPYLGFTGGSITSTRVFYFSSQACTQGSGALASNSANKEN